MNVRQYMAVKILLVIGLAVANVAVTLARVEDDTCYKDCGCYALLSQFTRGCAAGATNCFVAECATTCTSCGYSDAHTDWCDYTAYYLAINTLTHP